MRVYGVSMKMGLGLHCKKLSVLVKGFSYGSTGHRVVFGHHVYLRQYKLESLLIMLKKP